MKIIDTVKKIEEFGKERGGRESRAASKEGCLAEALPSLLLEVCGQVEKELLEGSLMGENELGSVNKPGIGSQGNCRVIYEEHTL